MDVYDATVDCRIGAGTRNGKEPDDFTDFLQKTMFPEIDFNTIEALKFLGEKKFRLGEILPLFETDAVMGVGLGVTYPKLVKKMWINTYEKRKEYPYLDEWRKHGLDVPEKQEAIPLDKMEEDVLDEVQEYLENNKPDLLEPLGFI